MRTTRTRPSVMVIGGSMAGLLAARVLSDHVDHVTIVERDRRLCSGVARRGVPQGRHAHALLAVGQQLLDGWFPGLSGQLADRGGVRLEGRDSVWHQGGAYRARPDVGFIATSMSRPLLEATVREQLLHRQPNVDIIEGAVFERLLVEDGRVVGVVVDGSEHRADLVVDCSGRNTRTLEQLAELGFPKPEVSSIHIDMAYATRVVTRRADDLDGTIGVLIGDPAVNHRMEYMLPIEGDRWIVTLGSFHGDDQPNTPEAFEEFARSLPSSEIADLLGRDTSSSPVMTYRMPASERCHVERLDHTLPGFVLLGDAVCSFNPIYGQGMASAALQAAALAQVVECHGVTSSALPRAFYRRAAKAVDAPWKIAAGGDFADPRTTGPKPFGTDLVNTYLQQVLLAAHTSVAVSTQMLRVQNLLAPASSLVRPLMIARVMIAARRSPARTRRLPVRRLAGVDVPRDPATSLHVLRYHSLVR